jgi:2-polyprenyl-6-methoxyphenol hydroxylase-like FAD-dependent oxidoreductase
MVQLAIIGGGIGGLTAALALRQCGFEPEVFEQAPALLDVGSAIALWPNAMRVLDRLQLADKILERAGVLEEVRWLDQHGRLINGVRISGGRRFPSVALHRADLQHILLQALPETSIHLGHSLVSYELRDCHVITKFTNGNSIESDFLIAADGVHSRVRAEFIKDGDPIERGYTIWRGISPAILSAIPPGTALELYGRGKRFGIGPIGLGRTGWWATVNNNHADDLSELFAGWYRPVLELIETTPPSSILKTGAFDRLPVRNWGDRRMTMLGDAIHPTTPNLGQGGCLAMEDAVVLARCFEKYGASEQALRGYERCRYQRTTMISRYSRYYGSVGQWENVCARAARRTALALVPETLALRLMQIFFDYDATLARV